MNSDNDRLSNQSHITMDTSVSNSIVVDVWLNNGKRNSHFTEPSCG